jgi:hypothetical protein
MSTITVNATLESALRLNNEAVSLLVGGQERQALLQLQQAVGLVKRNIARHLHKKSGSRASSSSSTRSRSEVNDRQILTLDSFIKTLYSFLDLLISNAMCSTERFEYPQISFLPHQLKRQHKLEVPLSFSTWHWFFTAPVCSGTAPFQPPSHWHCTRLYCNF